MNSKLRLSALPILLAAVCACNSPVRSEGTAAAMQSDGRASSSPLLPRPRGPLTLKASTPDQQFTVQELLTRLSQLTGVTYSMSTGIAPRILNESITLSQGIEVPIDGVYPWVESLLSQQGFTLGILDRGATPLVGVFRQDVPGQRPPAYSIDAEHLEECRLHPATMFNTTINAPHIDVRSLGNSMRILSPDTQSGGVIPVGTTNSVMLEGSGSFVAKIAEKILSIDEKAKQERAAAPAAPGPAKP